MLTVLMFLLQWYQLNQTPATLRLAVLMPNVETVSVHVYQNTKEIRTVVADQNVFWTLTVHEIGLVSITNVETHAQEPVDKVHDVMS